MPSSPANVLFQPLNLGGLKIENRIVLGPMTVLRPDRDGHPTPQTKAFLIERVKGGVGLIIVGGSVATASGYAEAPFQPILRFDDDRFVPKLKDLTEAIHDHGVPIIAQVFPRFGRMGVPDAHRPLISASALNLKMGAPNLPKGLYIPGGRITPVPEEATIEQIREVQEETVSAAVRAQSAGFDGVEIAAHMSYFFSSFLSPLYNHREDEYGGSAENRARILTETVAMLTDVLGPGYPIGLRMSAHDHKENGQGPEGYAEVASYISREGLAYIALTEGNYESMHVNLAPGSGNTLAFGGPQAFRRAVGDVPLFLSSTYDPVQAAEAINAGHADAIMLARQLLADPQYPNKVREGRIDEIRWCDHGNSCIRRLILNLPVRCHLNPEMGREAALAGHKPDLQDVLKKPVQDLIASLTGSPKLMGVADKLASARKTS